MNEIKDTLKRVRLVRGLSMGELSELSGVSKATISKVESGNLTPSYSVISKILKSAGFKLYDALPPQAVTDDALERVMQKQGGGEVLSAHLREMHTAAKVSPIASREGVKNFKTTVPEIVSWCQKNIPNAATVLAISGMEAVDGSASLTPIVYIDQNIETPWGEVPIGAQGVIVLPLTSRQKLYSYVVDGVRLLDQRWALMDSLAYPGRQPDAALEKIRSWQKKPRGS